MSKFYVRPAVKPASVEFSPLQGQYQFLVTSACPVLNSAPFEFVFNEHQIISCDETCDGISSPPATVTCTNIEGSFNLSVGTASAGGGINCPDGFVSCVLPIEVTPELPSDCIIDTLFVAGSGDQCEPI